MSKVKLGDVVVRIKDSVDRNNTDLLYYIGGEHFDERSLTVTRKGIIKGSTIGPAFSTKFRSGDVLLMSRNPHLRKAGMVNFEGICSDVSYIIRTRDENVIMQKFIPILFQSDAFWTFAEKNKKGSTNFFLNWSDFERFEFDLPDHETQEKLCNTLWAINDTIDSYKEMIKQSDELIKAMFVEMFNNKENKSKKLSEIASKWLKGQPLKKDDIDGGGKNYCIHYGELFTKYGIYIDKVISKTNITPKIISKYGDILFPASDVTPLGLTKCSALLMDNIIIGGDVVIMRPIKGLNSTWLSYAIRMQKDQLLNRVTGSIIRHISAKSLQTITIEIPSIEEQNKFEILVKKIDKIKFDLNGCRISLETLYKKIVNKYLINEEN